jgi:Bacterial regulatory proteins, tetR family
MTREDILEAAAQVFRQKGFHGASMNDIAEAVSLQKASITMFRPSRRSCSKFWIVPYNCSSKKFPPSYNNRFPPIKNCAR